MFVLSLLISLRAAYKDVDFPEPVGPDTTTIPYGCLITFLNVPKFCFGNPREVRLKSNPVLSKSLITIFSPYTVGNIETLMSISFPGAFMEKRPS